MLYLKTGTSSSIHLLAMCSTLQHEPIIVACDMQVIQLAIWCASYCPLLPSSVMQSALAEDCCCTQVAHLNVHLSMLSCPYLDRMPSSASPGCPASANSWLATSHLKLCKSASTCKDQTHDVRCSAGQHDWEGQEATHLCFCCLK